MENLAKKLADFKEAWASKANASVVNLFEEGIEELVASGIVENALKTGDTVEDFTLLNARSNKVSLSTLLKSGPVVLTWYRGGWCPYCNIQLQHLQKHLPDIKKLGATLLALTPETPDNSLSTSEKNELQFEVLTDFDNKVAEKFGVVFKLNEELIEIYNGFHKLEMFNGVSSNELPIPATYIIDQSFKIRFAHIDPDYRRRVETSEIINTLKIVSNVEA